MNEEEVLEFYTDNREASLRTWRALFDKETGGTLYRKRRASFAFSLNDYPKPFDFTIVEFSSQPTLEITNGEVFIIPVG